jgi:hypothetical protein
MRPRPPRRRTPPTTWAPKASGSRPTAGLCYARSLHYALGAEPRLWIRRLRGGVRVFPKPCFSPAPPPNQGARSAGGPRARIWHCQPVTRNTRAQGQRKDFAVVSCERGAVCCMREMRCPTNPAPGQHGANLPTFDTAFICIRHSPSLSGSQ